MDPALTGAVPQLLHPARDRLSRCGNEVHEENGGDEPRRARRVRRLALGLAVFSLLMYFMYYLAGYLVR